MLETIFTYGAMALFVFWLFRSNQRRKKQAQEMEASIAPGMRVVTMAGIIGRIISVDEQNVVIETAGSKIEIVKASIRSVSAWEPAVEPEVEAATSDEGISTYEVPKKATRKPSTRKSAAKSADEN